MSYTIAITGKGGVGKTTIAGLLVERLIARACSPVLAVDADPNTCLDSVLGVQVESTVGRIREEARHIAGKGELLGISKQDLLELKIAESLVEANDFDLIAMGRSEGPGCYCYANNVLRQVIGKISDSYPFTVIDNEAGLENLSRRMVGKVDLMVMVTDPSRRGLDTVYRLHQLTDEMEISFERLCLVVNRLRSTGLPRGVGQLGRDIHADFVIGIPDDPQWALLAERGEPLSALAPDGALIRHVDRILNDAMGGTPSS